MFGMHGDVPDDPRGHDDYQGNAPRCPEVDVAPSWKSSEIEII